ncbi:hypothetical protein MKZ20_17500 [Psychrobacillus sp. FSL K6-2684]|uniref:hypothetical protein n=1 Tax=Psychrobacillus sp. FSL K6-2684 TaxID=2921547 RepID=UPI0030F5F541
MSNMMNLIRVGEVDGINEAEGTIRVTFPDRDDMIAEDIALFRSEQWFPEVGESVVCLFLPNGIQQGFCLGPYFNDEHPPYIPNKNMYVKRFNDGLELQYDLLNKSLIISAENPITINGESIINGDLTINGNLTVTGVITGTISS